MKVTAAMINGGSAGVVRAPCLVLRLRKSPTWRIQSLKSLPEQPPAPSVPLLWHTALRNLLRKLFINNLL